jgi:hypothetical protein
MLVECERDTYGTPQTGLFIRGQMYDINPADPWAIHFKFPPAERKIALTEHRRRTKEAAENRARRAKAVAGGMTGDEFDEYLKTEEVTVEKFVCSFPGCGKESATKAGIGAHERAAHPEPKVA